MFAERVSVNYIEDVILIDFLLELGLDENRCMTRLDIPSLLEMRGSIPMNSKISIRLFLEDFQKLLETEKNLLETNFKVLRSISKVNYSQSPSKMLGIQSSFFPAFLPFDFANSPSWSIRKT